ncbi:DUF4247 domain-containing protein [Streptomyces polyrhachis]|uniref:DUF4247 domain-containing protein n=1 Tax=Streptomyces polyrhachis TaxID=1282885 RepID=A0ABW2GHV0_9ACTN
MKSSRLIRGAVAAVLGTLLLTACSGGDGNAAPRGWISDTYDASGAGWTDPDSRPQEVADAIHGHSGSLDRTTGDGMHFLRYADDMVTVSPRAGGSLVEIEDYRSAYNRHRRHVYGVMPDPDSEEFRGGGPGEGK